MQAASGRRAAALERAAAALARAGARLTVSAPGIAPIPIGDDPGVAAVVFRDPAAIDALADGDHLALAEAYLAGRIDLDGDLREVLKITDVIELDESPWQRARLALRLLLRGRSALARESVAFHYDRPPEFFLPWFERWRSYSHGFYRSPGDDPSAAQARKMQHAIDALGLAPGMRVLDMGAGWGCFVEYAGLQGIRVHGITISREQHRFVEDLIRARALPCSVELVDFFAHRPAQPYDGAVFMGTFEHVGDYRRAADRLREHLTDGARVYADFCAQRSVFRGGRFMKKWIWPGTVTYVDVAALVGALVRAGFNVHELADDTLSYAFTVRDWARRLEAQRKEIADRFGEPAVRAFLLFLWGSHHFLASNRTQAYHLVAGRQPRAVAQGLRAAPQSASGMLAAQSAANRSPARA
jgi:cyclopropane-fatty-acyl-phospholipid synthase